MHLLKYFGIMIFAGVCHTKSDRMGVALAFVPQKNEKKSLQHLDNLIECGLPCFKENGEPKKDMPDTITPGDCCDCCEGENKLYQKQPFHLQQCGDCIKNFLLKARDVPKIKKCVEEKNKAINIINEEVQITYECYECEEDDAGKV